MKKILRFTKRRKGSPSASETASVLSVGYDLKEKDLSKLHKAAFNGDLAKLRQLAKKSDLNQLDKENRTALHIACVHGHTEVVQYLVENKVKLNLCDNQNRSALMKAVQCQQDRCVSILLEHEADPNLVDINGNTALHLAARIPSLTVALKLLEHEANINAQNKEGNSPLILSVEESHAEMAEFLLKEGADVNLQNQEKRTPLLIAACNGQISMVRLLLQYNADITVKDNKGWSSDDYAVMNGHHACSHLIIEHGTKKKALQSPSHLASDKNKQTSLLGSPKDGFALRGPTLGKDDTEDNSHADSISRHPDYDMALPLSACRSTPSKSDNTRLDKFLQKLQKINLKKLMSASKFDGKKFAEDQDPEKSWSGNESEPISKGKAVEPSMAFPSSSTSTQLPVTPKYISFSNPSLMTSTPIISSQKLPCGNKSDEEASESSEEESEEGEDVEDSEEEDEEEDENEEDKENSEDDEESDDEREQEEETSVAITQEDDNERDLPEITAIEEREESHDIQMHVDVNTEPIGQPETSNILIEKSDHAKEHFSLFERVVSKKKEFLETAVLEVIERQKIMHLEITDEELEKGVSHTLGVNAGTLLSGIRVHSTCADKEENYYSNTGTTGAFRTPPHIAGTSPKTTKNFEDDEDEHNEAFRAGNHGKADVLKFLENTLVVESNIKPKQSKTGGMVSKQPHETGDEKAIINDMKADDTVLKALSQLSTVQINADVDSIPRSVNDTMKPSELISNPEEPESSEDSWGSCSDNEKEGSVESDTSDIEPVNCKDYEREHMTIEEHTVIHYDDDENLPVSMIVGSDDLEDAKDGELICHEEIPQTVIDDIDETFYFDKNDVDEERGILQPGEVTSSSEDEYDEEDEDEECDEESNKRSEAKQLEKTEASKKRDFLSELGIEKRDQEEDSPWDSESGSDSSSKKGSSGHNSPAKSHKPMSSIHEESNEALHYIPSFLRGSKHSSVFRSVARPGGQKAVVLISSQEEEDSSDEEKSEEQHDLPQRKPVSVLNKLLESKDARQNTDVMEELGLVDVDLEDASDWDSASTTSKASKNMPVYEYREVFKSEISAFLPVAQEQDLHTGREEEKDSSFLRTCPMPSPRSFKPLTSTQIQPQPQTHIHKEFFKKPVSDEDSDWDTDNTFSPAKITTPLPNIAETETVSPSEEERESGCSSEANEHPEEERAILDTVNVDFSSSCQVGPSESHTTEVEDKEEDKEKQEFVEHTSFHETTWEQRYEKIWVEIEKKKSKSQYKNVTAELKERFGEITHKEQSETAQDTETKDEEDDANKYIKKDTELSGSAAEEVSSEDEEELIVQPNTQAKSVRLLPIPEQRESGQEESYSEDPPKNDFAKHKDIQKHSVETMNEISKETENSSYHRAGDNAEAFSNVSENKDNISLAQLDDIASPFAVNQESSQEDGISPLYLVEEARIPSSIPDELVEEGLQRSLTEGGVMRTELKSSALWSTSSFENQIDIDQGKHKKADTNPNKPTPKQEGTWESGSQQKDDTLKKRDRVLPKWPTRSQRRRTKHIKDPMGSLLHAPAPKQSRDPCPVNPHNGDPLSVFDDSTLSEVSEDEGRSPSQPRVEKKNGGELEIADDFDDLTQSSDTATEELDSVTSGYFNASQLIKQLDTSSIDSVSMVKLQNIFYEYEHTIQKECNKHKRLSDKISQLEQERNELKLLLDESRESKSNMEHLRLELETDINNLKFLLKQEQEKHHSASMLYDKTREQLFRKEEQHRDEAEEKEKVELNLRNLELELRALMNNMKQLEEDRNETQRLLVHERSARTLQEDLLNNHLRKQQDIEEKNLRNLTKTTEATSQLTEANERERELLQQVCTLQEELSSVRAELEHFRLLCRQEESRLVDERDALRERLEDARRDLKLNDETLAQTIYQYNGQVSTLKSECVLLSTKLEHERQVRQQLEAETETSKARLQVALQETERCQAACVEAERTLQREREQHLRSEAKQTSESMSQRDTVQSLSQKLSEAEARANSLENEWHRATLIVAEKTALLETATREREQARARLEDLEGMLQSERDRASRALARHDAMQERLAQAQSEGALLRQQLEEAQNRGTAKDQAVTDAQECFSQALNQLRTKGEERVQLVEERSKELATKNADLREQNYRLEQEKADRETSLRQLQQELADSLKKLSMCEASLEVNTRYRSDLEEEKVRTQKDLDRFRKKLQESEEHNIGVERRINSLMGTLDEKERDLISTGQKLQEALAVTTRSEQTIKQLEEAVQRLEIENARLEATVKQQNNRIEILEKEAQEATALTDSSPTGGVRNQLENLITNLQSSKMTLEDQLSREVQKQSMLSHNAHDSQALWEEELKNRSRFGLRLAELEKEKEELTNQVELEKKKAKKKAEQKAATDVRLEQEIKRNTELQNEMYRLRTLVKTAKKKLREQNEGALGSPLGSLRGEPSFRTNETEGALSRMKIKVDELQVQLEREASCRSKTEDMNRELKEQLSTLKSMGRRYERLERSKQQLEEEVMGLRRRVEAGVMDPSQAEQFRREIEERARQEIRHKLDEINLFLQTQAASQEALEQMKAANEASQRTELEQRIRELEAELSRAHTNQQDSLLQRDSSRTELERYRQLYSDELRLRKSLATKLDRTHERLAEVNTKLLSERQRSKSFLNSSIINGSLGGPALDAHPSLGRLGLGASLLSPVGEQHTNRVEAYLAKMQSELEKSISKELEYGTTELEGASTRMSPVGSACGSQKNLNSSLTVEKQEPLSRATQQYLEVLKKNYMI
ncbi:ankyrin repeat domain-containing protein 26 isoform X1 [Silurus asotus]|uniref:Ankyrin repeat domain-containing protein 26 isoform X1 n=1 Tax=Silurus asotus TaxID=30991 RepID=A0AAD5FS34_SILAS|nr:ankyrin repeat domain-containing protein 26 isoform X1 [Silurus asotus]